MIKPLVKLIYILRYGCRGGLRPPLGPYRTRFQKIRFRAWSIENKIYQWTGLTQEWHQHFETGQIKPRGNLICWLFGHKITFYESGYECCGRCEKHAYHDSETWDNVGNLRPDIWLKNRIHEYKTHREHRKAMKAIDNGEPPF